MTDPAHTASIRVVSLAQPIRWLERGYRDFTRTFFASLAHGLLVAGAGLAILTIALLYWPLLPGAFSGFVLVGPILATGLYELSRRLERGQRPKLAHALAAWQRGTRALIGLGLLLFAAATAWVLVSAALFVLFVKAPIHGPEAFLRYAVAQSTTVFLLWCVLGGLGAALVFALTVVSAPLLLDRDIALKQALLASVRAVGANPFAMAMWATIIMLATALSVATMMLGFVFAIPLIGHATWHAYRDVLDASALPPRE